MGTVAISSRIKEIKEAHATKYVVGEGYSSQMYLSIIRSRCYTKVFKETEGQPISIRSAKAVAAYFDSVPIFISPKSLIVGFHVESKNAVAWPVELNDAKGILEYIKNGWVEEKDVAEYREIADYWMHRTPKAVQLSLLTEHERFMTEVGGCLRYPVSWPNLLYLSSPDHDTYLKTGLNNIIIQLKQTLTELYSQRETCIGPGQVDIIEKISDTEAMIIAAEAFLRWTKRYSVLAKEMAEKETDPQRKEELLQIAEICAWVPGNPARNFWEAIQSHWFAFIGYGLMEGYTGAYSMWVDDIFWPYYEKDVLIDHSLSRDKALELLESWLIATDEIGMPGSPDHRESHQGMAQAATLTLGGVKEDGSDNCNELTLLALDAIEDLRLCNPDFKFRWHPKVDPKVWRRVVEVIRTGIGSPSIRNDPEIITALMSQCGFSLEEARSWAIDGCTTGCPTHDKGVARRDHWLMNVTKLLEMTLNNGKDPVPLKDKIYQISPQTGDVTKFASFDELVEAFTKQVQWGVRTGQRNKNIELYATEKLCRRPLASCFYHRSLEANRDVNILPFQGIPHVNIPGIVDTIDSLVSLKKLVFDDKKYTMAEVVKALNENWVGYERMRQDFINAPKFGNDDDYADDIAKMVWKIIEDELSKVKEIHGGTPYANGLIVTYMYGLASRTGALPNGRKLGDTLADGAISPHAGYDKNGPMATILSASKIDSLKRRGAIFNQKLIPSCVEGEAGLRKFQRHIESAMNLGLDLIQFNVVDKKTLLEAQRNPKEHSDLIVRVSGYNARFVDLNKPTQDAVIARTQHALD